ncbi:WD repeat-containing protein 7-like isoform X2 [Babylonia areolata]|uniref:WD repeat-containing protein 7-like isoform X2 n=1 Tax=Babylonia areolata TaxID=304850 RepID=UPI003FD6157B
MTSGSSIVVPMVLWGRHAPTHCISTILMTPDMKHIVTGCNDGQICIWDVADNWQVCPRSLLFGHSAAISCLTNGSHQPDQQFIVSSSENGEMCLWDISDGRCIEHTKMSYLHTDITDFHSRSSNAMRLLCNGYYPEVLILDPHSFEIIHTLCSQVSPDWISACCHILPPNRQDDVILAISNSGTVKVWTIVGNESKVKMEDESKQIRCLNAQTLTCCPFNQRTVLIVCAKYWQVYNFEQLCGRTVQGIYDASDFTLLCSESNRCRERWAGGHFLSIDRVIVWSTDGRGYLYKLPTNTNPDSGEYHRSHHHHATVHAYYVLDLYNSHSPACYPALTFVPSKRGERRSGGLLLRGDAEGRVVVWQVPEVSERQMTLVRQESFDRLPALTPKLCTTLQDLWNTHIGQSPGLLHGLCEEEGEGGVKVTATIYIPSQGRVVCGRENGTIVIVPAVTCVIKQLTGHTPHNQEMAVKKLSGHDGRVTCLLYPFSECTRYEPHHLLSGGLDFSVILWDINSGSRIHTFTVHGGMLEQLIVPPANCNPRILSSVCSVASDHSVALLSLKERKCVMLASRHLFPVKVIRWRPLDDFMVVSCTDGTVYVWQMETGCLDRVVNGITAEEIVNNCDENALPKETLTNPSLTLAQALKRRNLATFRNLAQQKLQQSSSQQVAAQGPKAEFIKPSAFPLLIQGVRTNTTDPDAHVLFFDTESLIVQLLSEEFSLLSPGELEARGLSSGPLMDRKGGNQEDVNEAQQKLAGFIAKARETAENVSQKLQSRMDLPGNAHSSPGRGGGVGGQSTGGGGGSTHSPQCPRHLSLSSTAGAQSLSMQIAQLLMSCLHAWGLDPDLDRLCVNKLGLLKPRCPVSFGLLSYQGHMSLMLPGWQAGMHHTLTVAGNPSPQPTPGGAAIPQNGDVGVGVGVGAGPQRTGKEGSRLPKATLLAQRTGSVPFDSDAHNMDDTDSEGDTTLKAEADMVVVPANPDPATTTKAVGANAANGGMGGGGDYSTKVRWQLSSAITTQHLLSVISIANTLMSMTRATFLTQHLYFLHHREREVRPLMGGRMDGVDAGLEEGGSEAATLAQAQIKQGWSLLAALHCVLLPELIGVEHYRSPQLEMLARRWQDRCLEIREAAQALLLAELRRMGGGGRKVVIDQWAPYLPTRVDPKVSILSDAGKEEEEEEEEEADQMLGGDLLSKTSLSFENRRRQATAIVMLGVVGAEFGQEIEPSRRKVEEGKKEKKGKSQEGFSLSNCSLARQTSRALTFLLLSPASSKLPAYTPIRRAAIDLLGRGFTVWEPYLDISAVLMGLLELCVDAEKRVPSVTYGLPLSPASDACRTARHALSLIATARPPAFIITLAKEVARYNAMAHNAQSQHTHLQSYALVRGASEILHIIEMLVDKMPNDVADLIIEVMDITMHCLDLNHLKARGLQDLFPAICRFSMVSYCAHTKRIWVGAKSGGLALYEMKQHSKCQMIHAHNGPVVAVAVSPDGKYLATYSHKDQRIKLYQTASSSIFSLGSQQTKCVRQYTANEIALPPLTNVLKLARLVWTDSRSVVLLGVDGSETKYGL